MIVFQLPTKIPEKIVDHALNTHPSGSGDGNGYELALATPYILLILFVVGGYFAYKDYWKRKEKEYERDEKRREKEIEAKKEFSDALKREVHGMREDFNQGLEKIRQELAAEGKEWRTIAADLDKRIFILEARQGDDLVNGK